MCVARQVKRHFWWIAAGILMATIEGGSAKADEKLRTWTNHTETRQAQARLVSVEGSEIRLRSTTGASLRTTPEALSESDRRYVRQFVTRSSAPAGAMPVVRGWLNNLPGVPGAFAQLTKNSGASDSEGADSPGIFNPLMPPLPEQLPAELVHVRLSKDFLEHFVEGDVEREQAIHDEILGTSIRGRVQTRGNTTLILHPGQEQAIAEVIFKGTLYSRTIGHNGPVRLHCTSHTPFESHKFIYFGPKGIQALGSTSTARTRSHTERIDATLPGLRGRIAERVAWNRSRQLKSQADAIASRHTEQRLNAEFDRSIEQSIAEARTVLRDKLDQLPTQGTELPTKMAYRSTPEYLEIVLSSSDAIAAPESVQPVYEEAAKIAVRVHRAALRSAITDPQVRRALRPLLIGLSLGDTHESAVQPASTPLRKSPEFHVAWSDDQEWLEIDFGRKKELPAPAKVAVAER